MKTIETALKREEVFEKDEIHRLYPNARFVRGMLITSIKDEQSSTNRKFKGRFVALGNRLVDYYGTRILEELRHFVPCMFAGNDSGLSRVGTAKSTRSKPSRRCAGGVFGVGTLRTTSIYRNRGAARAGPLEVGEGVSKTRPARVRIVVWATARRY